MTENSQAVMLIMKLLTYRRSHEFICLFIIILHGIVCKVRTQDPENFHEEVKSLVTAWCSTEKKQENNEHQAVRLDRYVVPLLSSHEILNS